jgi:hypothetical protein
MHLTRYHGVFATSVLVRERNMTSVATSGGGYRHALAFSTAANLSLLPESLSEGGA